MMKFRRVVSLSIMFFSVATLMAHYSIHSATPGVTVESTGKTFSAQKGLEVKANDYLNIPNGSVVEIYNDLDKKIYKSVSSGRMSVTKLMIEAKKEASDNSKNVSTRLSLTKSQGGSLAGAKIYEEKGMVRRSLAVFDPEADNLQVNSQTLGNILANYLRGKTSSAVNNVDIDVTTGVDDSNGVFFRVVNTLDFPVYFNVLKYSSQSEAGMPKVEISPLGQPDGSYVLPSGQALTRESFNPLSPHDRNIIVATHVRYDLDEVVEATSKSLMDKPDSTIVDNISFPLLIIEL